MGLFDDLDAAMKKVEGEINKAELDKQVKDLDLGMNKTGHEISAEIKKSKDSPPQKASAPAPASASSAGARSPHPGYAKIHGVGEEDLGQPDQHGLRSEPEDTRT
ncbi:MAG: hypothetical protein ABSG49_10215 [Methanoregula sp.]|uniref:hypothetical protein n=1 Tax=Methanoregula sp. TaxID=2052170 RepID=UPI003C1EB58B